MKKIFITIQIIIVVAFNSKAQNLIAVQNGASPSFFTQLDSAINQAQNGDTLFLPGGYISTSDTIFIDKSINIVGVGYRPDTNTATGNTILINNIEILPTVNGVSITGIYAINNSISIHDNVSNIKISRCLLSSIKIGSGSGILPPTNVHISETIANYGILSNWTSSCPQNVVIENSFIGNLGEGGYSRFAALENWIGLRCKNCILFGRSMVIQYTGQWGFMIGVQDSYFDNCIFMDSYGYGYFGNTTTNTFRSCMANQNAGYIPGLPSNLVYNYIPNQGIDQTFVNAPGNYFSLSNDYHLKPNSLGKNAGTDGTDIGIYGGAFPWKDGAVPFNPHVQYKQIAGTTDLNGNLNVKIKVEAQER